MAPRSGLGKGEGARGVWGAGLEPRPCTLGQLGHGATGSFGTKDVRVERQAVPQPHTADPGILGSPGGTAGMSPTSLPDLEVGR